jgi:hypothetical protein
VQGPLRANISRPASSNARRGGALLVSVCRPARKPDGEEAYFFLAFLVAFFFVAFLAVFFLAATVIHSPFEGNFPEPLRVGRIYFGQISLSIETY